MAKFSGKVPPDPVVPVPASSPVVTVPASASNPVVAVPAEASSPAVGVVVPARRLRSNEPSVQGTMYTVVYFTQSDEPGVVCSNWVRENAGHT